MDGSGLSECPRDLPAYEGRRPVCFSLCNWELSSNPVSLLSPLLSTLLSPLIQELEELYALKVELFKKNFDTIQELRAQLGEPQTGEKEEFSRVKVTSN